MESDREIWVTDSDGNKTLMIYQHDRGIWVQTPMLECIKLTRDQLRTLQEMLNDQLHAV